MEGNVRCKPPIIHPSLAIHLVWMEATIGNQKKDNTKLFSISQVVEPQRWLLCVVLCQSGWPARFDASLVV